MHSRSASIIIICGFLFATLALSGCGGKRAPVAADERHPVHPQIYEGSFVEALDQLYGNPYVTPCEIDRKVRIYELARELDSRKAELDRVLETTSLVPPGYVQVRVDGFSMLETLPPSDSYPDVWETETDSWDSFFATFSSIKGAGTPKQWADLRTLFGAGIMDDLNRTKWGAGFATGPQDQATLTSIRDRLYDCWKSGTCEPTALDDMKPWVEYQPQYKALLSAFANAKNKSAAGDALNEFYDLVEDDLHFYFGFRKNKSIQKADASTAVLPVHAIELAKAAAHFSGYVQSNWSGPGFNLKMDWAPERATDVYKLLLGKGPTGRAFVSYSKKEINLFNNVRDKTIIHEFGHVLGFPDRYYTIWDGRKCEYTFHFNRSDIMSNSRTGAVKSSDFDKLKRAYLSDESN